jgi:hypothetical protein
MFSKPTRKIGPNNRSITGKQPTRKSPGSQYFESALERDHLSLLEYDDEVEKYTAQPVPIYYENQGYSRRYTPDVAVYFKPELYRKPLLIEVKYEAELIEKKDELEPKFTAARKYAGQCGYEFRIVTENEIRTDRLYNIKFLSRYKGQKTEAGLVQLINSRFLQQPRLTPAELTNDDSSELNSRLLYTMWQLAADRVLVFDMDKKITMNTEIWKK